MRMQKDWEAGVSVTVQSDKGRQGKERPLDRFEGQEGNLWGYIFPGAPLAPG